MSVRWLFSAEAEMPPGRRGEQADLLPLSPPASSPPICLLVPARELDRILRTYNPLAQCSPVQIGWTL